MPAARVEYKASVAGDLDRLDRGVVLRVLRKIEKSLADAGAAGEPLSGEFAGLFGLGVVDDRVIYARTTEGYFVLRIGHRADLYRGGQP